MTLKEKVVELESRLVELRKERDDYRVRQMVEKEQLEKRIAELEAHVRDAEQSARGQRERAARAEGASDALLVVMRKAGLAAEGDALLRLAETPRVSTQDFAPWKHR